MKTFALTLFAMIGLASAAMADPAQDGNTAFAQGDYAAAVRSYETAIAAGTTSAGLYYNLGMAQVRDSERPAAAVSFRRAIMLDPQMIDARMALSELEKSQGVSVRTGWPEKVAEKAPLQPLMIAGNVIAWAGAFLFLFGIFRKSGKVLPIFAAVVFVLLGGAMLAAGYLADPKIQEARSGVISADGGTALLSAPADQSDTITKLPACSPVKILKQSGDWTYCEASGGQKGWTSAKAITPVLPAT